MSRRVFLLVLPVLKTHKRLKNELYLIRTRQNNVHIFGKIVFDKAYHISCFIIISVCPFVALSKAKLAEIVHIVLSSPY